jgi:CheY-like chemotaxis protein
MESGEAMRQGQKQSGNIQSVPGKALTGLRVLVVDDAADARKMISAVLSQWGAEVRTSASTSEALEALEHWRPDVLVSDIGMPGEDGYALIHKVRERCKGIPAAALTAYAREDDRKRALAAGYQIHVAKPVGPAELVATVADLAGRIP